MTGRSYPVDARGRPQVPVQTNIAPIPPEIQDWKAWLVMKVYRDGSGAMRKRPIAPNEGNNWNSRSELLTLKEAYVEAHSVAEVGDHFRSESLVLALRLPDKERLVVVDCDVDGEVPMENLPDAIRELEAGYVERSTSGLGLHAVGFGDLGGNLTKTMLSEQEGVSVEIYTRDHLIIFTGDVVDDQTEILELNEESLEGLVDDLRESHDPHRCDNDSLKPSTNELSDSQRDDSPSNPTSITDIGAKRAKGWCSRNRGRTPTVSTSSPTVEMVKATGFHYDSEFKHLWEGGSINKPSPSEVDSAFVGKLVFWCRGDVALIDRCFRRSSRYGIRSERQEPKWNADRGEQTWGQLTIGKALKNNSDRYQGEYISPDRTA